LNILVSVEFFAYSYSSSESFDSVTNICILVELIDSNIPSKSGLAIFDVIIATLDYSEFKDLVSERIFVLIISTQFELSSQIFDNQSIFLLMSRGKNSSY
jgi:hypothetical protein